MRLCGNVIGKQFVQVAEPRSEGRAEEAGREAETDPIRGAIRRDSLRQRGISPAAAPLVENEAREERDRLVAEMLMYEPNYRAPNTVGTGGEASNPIDQRGTVKEDLARARENAGIPGPNFIVTRGGTAFPVPQGAQGPTPVVNPAGA